MCNEAVYTMNGKIIKLKSYSKRRCPRRKGISINCCALPHPMQIASLRSLPLSNRRLWHYVTMSRQFDLVLKNVLSNFDLSKRKLRFNFYCSNGKTRSQLMVLIFKQLFEELDEMTNSL